MAGFDKVCELTGEYIGSDMHGYSHNHIQVQPSVRKLFRGATAIIYVQPDGKYWLSNKGYITLHNEYEASAYGLTEKELIEWRKTQRKHLRNMYRVSVVVQNPSLQGKVRGKYSNIVYDLKTFKRKMKRLFRCRTLNIVELNNEAILRIDETC